MSMSLLPPPSTRPDHVASGPSLMLAAIVSAAALSGCLAGKIPVTETVTLNEVVTASMDLGTDRVDEVEIGQTEDGPLRFSTASFCEPVSLLDIERTEVVHREVANRRGLNSLLLYGGAALAVGALGYSSAAGVYDLPGDAPQPELGVGLGTVGVGVSAVLLGNAFAIARRARDTSRPLPNIQRREVGTRTRCGSSIISSGSLQIGDRTWPIRDGLASIELTPPLDDLQDMRSAEVWTVNAGEQSFAASAPYRVKEALRVEIDAARSAAGATCDANDLEAIKRGLAHFGIVNAPGRAGPLLLDTFTGGLPGTAATWTTLTGVAARHSVVVFTPWRTPLEVEVEVGGLTYGHDRQQYFDGVLDGAGIHETKMVSFTGSPGGSVQVRVSGGGCFGAVLLLQD